MDFRRRFLDHHAHLSAFPSLTLENGQDNAENINTLADKIASSQPTTKPEHQISEHNKFKLLIKNVRNLKIIHKLTYFKEFVTTGLDF